MKNEKKKIDRIAQCCDRNDDEEDRGGYIYALHTLVRHIHTFLTVFSNNETKYTHKLYCNIQKKSEKRKIE